MRVMRVQFISFSSYNDFCNVIHSMCHSDLQHRDQNNGSEEGAQINIPLVFHQVPRETRSANKCSTVSVGQNKSTNISIFSGIA